MSNLEEELQKELSEMRSMKEEFKKNMAEFNTRVAAETERAQKERVSGIVTLAKNAGREGEYPEEKLMGMTNESLDILENSLKDLIAEQAKTNKTDEGSGSHNHLRGGSGSAEPLSSYERVDMLADIVANAFNLPIPGDEVKREVWAEHQVAEKPITY